MVALAPTPPIGAYPRMFVAILTYVRPLQDVDALISEHVSFLDQHYASGLFLASGRRVPRTGGFILISGVDRALAESVLERDPFFVGGVASFELFEFTPTRAQPSLAAFVQAAS
jgi:uncharacterized protein YciI